MAELAGAGSGSGADHNGKRRLVKNCCEDGENHQHQLEEEQQRDRPLCMAWPAGPWIPPTGADARCGLHEEHGADHVEEVQVVLHVCMHVRKHRARRYCLSNKGRYLISHRLAAVIGPRSSPDRLVE